MIAASCPKFRKVLKLEVEVKCHLLKSHGFDPTRIFMQRDYYECFNSTISPVLKRTVKIYRSNRAVEALQSPAMLSGEDVFLHLF